MPLAHFSRIGRYGIRTFDLLHDRPDTDHFTTIPPLTVRVFDFEVLGTRRIWGWCRFWYPLDRMYYPYQISVWTASLWGVARTVQYDRQSLLGAVYKWEVIQF